MVRQVLGLLGLLILALNVNAIDYKEVEENGIPPLAENFNVEWMVGVSKWYMLMGNKYSIFRFADSFLGEATKKIDEATLKDTLCLATKLTKKGEVKMDGFGKTLSYFMEVTGQKQVNSFRLHDAGSRGSGVDTAGISYTTLSDNESYFLAIIYWDVGQRSWIVLSKDPTLSTEKHKKILAHIKKAGFDEKKAFVLDYTTCSKDRVEL